MPTIRPISDLRNNFAEITREAQESSQPIFLTKNGAGALVVMSMEAYEANLYESEVYAKLREAEVEAASGIPALSREQVMTSARARVKAALEAENV